MSVPLRALLLLWCSVLVSSHLMAQDNATTFYWVGGDTGNWSDVNSWSLTSGNTGLELASRVPTINDNVIFDDNSGFGITEETRTVTINAESYVHNFEVLVTNPERAPRFRISGITLNISGDFTLCEGVVWADGISSYNASTIRLTSQEDQLFDPADVPLRYTNVIIADRPSGYKVSLQSSLTINTLDAVAFVSNDYDIYVEGRCQMLGEVELGSSELNVLTFSGGGPGLNAGTSHIIVRSGTASNDFMARANTSSTFYDVTFTGTKAVLEGRDAKFRNVVFEKPGTFSLFSGGSYENLTLAPGSLYRMSGTHRVSGTFTAFTPDCEGMMEFVPRGSNGQEEATIEVASGTVTVPNVRMTNIKATGGAVFNAIGVDNGGNDGWSFQEPGAKIIYWVGDARDGYWNNRENWAATSGGEGGFCVPTQFDDVVFDEHSDASVQIEIPAGTNAYCHDITVTGWDTESGVLRLGGGANGTAQTLNIYGQSSWKNGMEYLFYLTYYRSSDMGEELTFDGVGHDAGQFGRTYFSGLGSWIFKDDFSGRYVTLEEGELNTNSQKVYLTKDFETSGTLAKTLILGASEVNVDVWKTRFSLPSYAENFTLDAGTSHIIVRGSEFDANAGEEYWDMTAEGVGTVRIYSEEVSFNNVNIQKSTDFAGGKRTYQNLTLAAMKVYTFSSGSRQIILGDFIYDNPDCGGLTEFRGVAPTGTSEQAVFEIASGVHLPNVMMTYIKAEGEGVFTATGVDLGGNENWTFVETDPKNLYWIGGSGDWFDAEHWTIDPNGQPTGGCIPTLSDNVFFNKHSGEGGIEITIEGLPGYCHDMTWLEGAPENAIFRQGTINIHGSYIMGSNMQHRQIIVNFLSSESEIIEFNGSLFGNATGQSSGNAYVFFDGTGTYTFQDDALINGGMRFNRGTLDFGGNEVTVAGFASSGNATRHLNIENARVLVGYGYGSGWEYTGTNLSLSAQDSYISTTNINFESANTLEWYDVDFNGKNRLEGTDLKFHHLRLLRDATIMGSNTYTILEVAQTQRTIILANNTTHTVLENAYLSGTPCQPNTIRGGTAAKLNIMAGNTEFDYITLRNIDASEGEHLTIHRNSTDGGGNENMEFLIGSGGLVGLGEDRSCYEIDPEDSGTYTLDASRLFGSSQSVYKWTKLNDPDHTGVLGTGLTLDIQEYGYGTYQVEVDYGGGSRCQVKDEITISKHCAVIITNPVLINQARRNF